MAKTATTKKTTGQERAAARLAAKLASHGPVPDVTSRQMQRRAARKAAKAKGRPGPRPALVTPKPIREGGPGSFERHVVTLSKFGDRIERTFHFTKGHRSRRVAA